MIAATKSPHAAFIAVLWLIPAGCASQRDTPPPKPTTLCAVALDPAAYDGQILRVPATVLSGGYHGSVLIDTRCPERGAALYFEESARDTANIAALEKAIWYPYPGTIDKTIQGDFIGRFKWDPRRRSEPVHDQPPSRILEVRDVLDLSVVHHGEPPTVPPPPLPNSR